MMSFATRRRSRLLCGSARRWGGTLGGAGAVAFSQAVGELPVALVAVSETARRDPFDVAARHHRVAGHIASVGVDLAAVLLLIDRVHPAAAGRGPCGVGARFLRRRRRRITTRNQDSSRRRGAEPKTRHAVAPVIGAIEAGA